MKDFSRKFLKKNCDWYGYMFEQNNFFTLFELFIKDFLGDFIMHLRMESLLRLRSGVDKGSHYTRMSQQGPLIITYRSTVTKSKSNENRSRKAYSLLKDSDLILKISNVQATCK